MRYLIVIVKEKNYGAFCPDVPGCVAIGDTFEECKKSMQEALAFHLEGDETLPVPHASPTILKLHTILTSSPSI